MKPKIETPWELVDFIGHVFDGPVWVNGVEYKNMNVVLEHLKSKGAKHEEIELRFFWDGDWMDE